jgi:hypothetical protein
MLIVIDFSTISTSCFHKNSFHYFLGLFNDESDLRGKVIILIPCLLLNGTVKIELFDSEVMNGS